MVEGEGVGAIFLTKINVIKADLSIQRDPEKILISKRRHVCRDAHCCTTYHQFSPDFCKISRRSDSKGRRLLDTVLYNVHCTSRGEGRHLCTQLCGTVRWMAEGGIGTGLKTIWAGH
jgi:hypothetical protein